MEKIIQITTASGDEYSDLYALTNEGNMFVQSSKDKWIKVTPPVFEKEVKKEAKQVSKKKYGEHKNVLLTDEEAIALKSKFKDAKERVDKLSEYIGSKGDGYKSHYITILSWAKKETNKESEFATREGYLHDGTRVINKFGQWVDAANPRLNLNPSNYPEIAKGQVLRENPRKRLNGEEYNKLNNKL